MAHENPPNGPIGSDLGFEALKAIKPQAHSTKQDNQSKMGILTDDRFPILANRSSRETKTGRA